MLIAHSITKGRCSYWSRPYFPRNALTCTVNLVTPALFARFRTAKDFAGADIKELETMIQSTGFFRNKAKNIKECCKTIVEQHGGEVPGKLEDLVVLPGIGRKTANVVLGNAFDVPGITVDTHVLRLSHAWG